MSHESRLVLNMTSDIGEMFADPNQLPPRTSETDILIFFQSMINEQETSYHLKNSDLDVMHQNISDFFDDLTSQKNNLVAEEGAEAAAEIVAGAASVAAVVGSWIPLVNFGLAAAAVAATATAMGLEFAAEKLENTIVAELSNSSNLISNKYPAFDNVKRYTAAVNANTIFYPRLQLGATIKQMRSLFLGVIITVKKENKGTCTPDLMKKAFLNYYGTTKANPDLVESFIQIMEELDKTKDVDKYKSDLDSFFKPLPPMVKRTFSSISVAVSAAKAIYYGKKWYNAYKAANELARIIIEDFDQLDIFGQVAEEGAASGEAEILSTAEIAGRALGFLGGLASIVFGGLEIATAVDTNNKFSQAISDAKQGITDYYTSLVLQTNDGYPSGANVGALVGDYECHLHDNDGLKNNWHYVNISHVDGGTLEWENRAGVSWALEMTDNKAKLEVGADCPYYSNGDNYKEATVVWDGNNVTGIIGPSKGLYNKKA